MWPLQSALTTPQCFMTKPCSTGQQHTGQHAQCYECIYYIALQAGQHDCDSVRVVAVLWPRRGHPAPEPQLRGGEDQEGGLVCLQLWRQEWQAAVRSGAGQIHQGRKPNNFIHFVKSFGSQQFLSFQEICLNYWNIEACPPSVDIYGSCGSLKCSRGNKQCFEMLNTDYKFYLAFENSNCQDYITEKFFVNGLG